MLCICLCGHTLKAPRDTGQSVDTQTRLLWNTVQNKMKRIGSIGKKRLHWVKDQQQVLSIYALNRKDCWCQFSLKITAGNKLGKESTEEFFFFFKCKTIKESLVKKKNLNTETEIGKIYKSVPSPRPRSWEVTPLAGLLIRSAKVTLLWRLGPLTEKCSFILQRF